MSERTIPHNTSKLLLCIRFYEVVKTLKEMYDVIIFDNPPVRLVSDGVQLLSKVDVPIYLFRANYSKRYFSDKLKEIAEINEIKNINVVLNAVETHKSTYGKNYGGYYTD